MEAAAAEADSWCRVKALKQVSAEEKLGGAIDLRRRTVRRCRSAYRCLKRALLKTTSMVCAGMDGGAGSRGSEARETETTTVPWTGGPLEYLQGDREASALVPI